MEVTDLEGITLPLGYEIDMHPEAIVPPEGTYFLRGIRNWTPNEDLKINMAEISVSLQKDGQTLPLRPYGYILEIDKGGIVTAHDRDITSEYGDGGTKQAAERSAKSNTRTYSEDELDELIKNTKPNSHNELIVQGNKVGVLKAYIVENSSDLFGLSQFRNDCLKKGIEIHIIPKQKVEVEEDYSI